MRVFTLWIAGIDCFVQEITGSYSNYCNRDNKSTANIPQCSNHNKLTKSIFPHKQTGEESILSVSLCVLRVLMGINCNFTLPWENSHVFNHQHPHHQQNTIIPATHKQATLSAFTLLIHLIHKRQEEKQNSLILSEIIVKREDFYNLLL